jgi:hypothetical protein
MKKLYTLIIAASVCSTANAQFTMLRAYHEPTVAAGMNVADMVRYDSIGTLPNTTGQAQNWNFSAMVKTNIQSNATYVAITTNTLDALFTGATIKAQHGGGNFTYYKSDSANNEFHMVGMANGGTNTMYSDSKMLYKWPILNTSSYNDTYASANGNGTYAVSTTGTGTLMLVGGKTFDNVMQLTASDQWSNTAVGDTFVKQTRSYIYYWSNNRYPLLIVNYNTNTVDSVSTRTTDILVNWLEAVGITDYNLESAYSVYPNPATNLVEVKLSNAGQTRATLSINSITGQHIRTIDLGQQSEISQTINVRDLAKGVYIVKVILGDKQGTKKLIIE